MIDLIPSWVAWMHTQQRSKKTIWKYGQHVRSLFEWLDGREPNIENLFTYRMHRQRDQRRKPATIRADFTALYDFFAWAEAHGHATNLPKRGSVKLPVVGEQEALAPKDAEVLQMIQAAETSPQHTARTRYLRARKLGLIAIFAGSGLRLQEVLALNVSDIDRTQSPWIVTVACGKGAQAGEVPFAEAFEPLLAEWLDERARWCYLHKHTTDALWPVDSRRRLAERGLWAIWQELVSQCGITWKFTPHCMRRWYGTKVQKVEGLATAQRMLRHKRMETTLKYLKTSQEAQVRAARTIRPDLTTETEPKRAAPPPPQRPAGRIPRTNRRKRAA